MKILILLIMISCGSSAQNNCNRAAKDEWDFLWDKLPNALFLPSETVLFDSYPLMDMNGDGLSDVCLRYLKEGYSDEDTLFTAIYFMNSDSSYSLIQVIRKIDVLYYEKGSSEYFSDMRMKTGNNYLYNELAGIHAYAPNNETIFDGNKIKISMKPGVGLKYRFEYVYDPSIQNWKHTKFIIEDDMQDPQIQSIEIEEPAPLITEFNITDYM
jgi:hypothetical protein